MDTLYVVQYCPRYWPVTPIFFTSLVALNSNFCLSSPVRLPQLSDIAFLWTKEANDLKWKNNKTKQNVVASIGLASKYLLFLENILFLFSVVRLVQGKLLFHRYKQKPQERILSRGMESYELSYILEYHSECWVWIDYRRKG